MTLISDDYKAAYSSVFQDIHDTFSRKVTIYKTPKRTVIATNPNYNFVYNDSQDDFDIEYTPVSGIIDARIKWLTPSEVVGLKDIKEEVHGNVCRLKIRAADIEWFDKWEHIEVDGKTVQYFGTMQPHGLFEPDFYTFYLEQSE